MLNTLFRVGVDDLILRLSEVFKSGNQLNFQAGMGRFSDVHHEHLSALPHVQLQDEADATEAPKLKAEEAKVDFSRMSALDIHNRSAGLVLLLQLN